MARKGLRPILDLLERERQLRLTARPLVVEGDLRVLMEAEYPLEESGGQGITRQVETIFFERALFPTKFLTELYNTLAQPGLEMFIGKIEVLAQPEDERPQ